MAGGRARPRRLRFMAALVASSRDPTLKAFHEGLRRRGQAVEPARTAVMRGLVGCATIVLRENRPWRAEPPPRPGRAEGAK
jgi:transposase